MLYRHGNGLKGRAKRPLYGSYYVFGMSLWDNFSHVNYLIHRVIRYVPLSTSIKKIIIGPNNEVMHIKDPI